MNYMEADVEQARVVVRALIRAQVVSLNEQKSLETLISAALEGAKVPGLVQQVADLQQKVCDWQAASGLESGSGDPDGIEPHHLEADLRKRDAEVSALQAKVAELTAARDDWKARAETLDAAGFKATRERDALRAQVAGLADEARPWAEPLRDVEGATVTITRPLSFWLALSAPPAETTSETTTELRCWYSDCESGLAIASAEEQVTCINCRSDLGLQVVAPVGGRDR